MINHLVDRFDAFALRHKRALAIVGGIWLIISWASSAHFLDLPEIPLLTGKTGVYASSAFAALWWAFINPRIAKRRAEREMPAPEAAQMEVGR